MKKYINFYIDESGYNLSDFFILGGFYIMDDNYSNIQIAENKIQANILRTEKSIKEFRKNKEKHLDQYILDDNSKSQKEVKWYGLSFQNKSYLVQNLKDLTQKNISIVCNLKKWKVKNNREINLDAIYNMMLYFLIDRTLNNSKFGINDEIAIKVFIDQRRVVPKILGQNQEIKNNNNNNNKLDSLEAYLSTQMYVHSQFTNLRIKVKQFESKSNPLIRYSDYYAGLISSMCRFINKTSKPWDEGVDTLFELIHKKIICSCHYTIKNQCKIITILCFKCKSK